MSDDRITHRIMGILDRIVGFVDVPPIWLAGFLALSWSSVGIFPNLTVDIQIFDFIGGLLVGGGVLLAALALMEMRRYKTTPIPHREAATLVQTGSFRWSRNPIYLGDLSIFLGLSLFWGAVICLPLVALLWWILTDRFIIPEEVRLSESFGRAFEDYSARTRRWL